jgi:hypothetical protein
VLNNSNNNQQQSNNNINNPTTTVFPLVEIISSCDEKNECESGKDKKE